MSSSKPITVGAITAGLAMVAGGLITGTASADEPIRPGAVVTMDEDYDDEYDSDDDERDDEDSDDDERDDEDSDDDEYFATPTPSTSESPSVAPVAAPAAAAQLSVERENRRRLAVEAEVMNALPGEQWRLEIWQNGKQRVAGNRLANTDGTAELDRSLKNRPGQDRIRVKAISEAGETVTAKVKGFAASPRAPRKPAQPTQPTQSEKPKPEKPYTSKPS